MHTMKEIKLIATDMDGTLLNSNGQIPDGFFDLLAKLHQHNIYFTVASGRPYPTLEMQFEPWKSELVIMAENGACIVANGEPIYVQHLSDDQLLELDALCRKLPHVHLIYSGFHKAYVYASTPDDVKAEICLYYKKIKYIQTLADIDEPVCKISVCDLTGAEVNALPFFKDLKSPYRATLAGYVWIDLGLDTTNKGDGLAALQKKYCITPEETMIFGDYLNDYEMMQQGYFSYAMANAHPDLKAVSRFETLANDENGVMHILKQVLDAIEA